MTAHPAWPQSQYDQNRAGLSPRLRGAPAEGVTRRRDVARWAALAAGFPDTAAGATVNRFCVAAIRLAATLTRGVRRVPEIDSRWWK
jgi:hypothetical protein